MKLKIQIPPNKINTTIIAEVILETKVILNLISSSIHSKGGIMIIEIPDNMFDIVKAGFTSRGASVIPLDVSIKRDEDECVDCGACISVCPTRVFSFDENWELQADLSKCTGCGLCTKMCPHKALEIPEFD
ncbi:MAG: 4Fe-4S dicluster domain-containing protein [Methanosarcinaceae archaeon]|nr:4Fe-4S dicluster domain-containing protein [Methanosarcinaceae archaeon]